MARLSNILKDNVIPEKYQDECKKCFFCFKDITAGGMWAGDHHIGVCDECADHLIDLLIDTLDDTRPMSLDEKYAFICEISKERIEKKDNINKELVKNSATQIMQLNYYADMGIIDLFGFGFSKEEIKERISNDINSIHCTGYENITYEIVDEAVREIKSIVMKKTGSVPHIIRFFAIPNFGMGTFDLGCVAKISDNGTTYMFAKDEETFEFMDRFNGYNPTVYKIPREQIK